MLMLFTKEILTNFVEYKKNPEMDDYKFLFWSTWGE